MAEQRLPLINGDDGQWGTILNQYLSKEHYDTGTNNAANGGHQNVTLRPGTTAAGTAPLKFISGPLMSSAEAGAVEFLSDKLYFTQTTSIIRKTIAVYDDSLGAAGDVYYRDTNADLVRLPVGTDNQVLRVTGGLPSWATTYSGLNKITVGTVAPSSPSVGDLWIDTN